MSPFVLDCSIAAAWLFEDEAAPATDALLHRLRRHAAFVPSLWRLELGNVLAQAERSKRTDATRIARWIERLEKLPIVVDPETGSRAFREILTLARQERLTTYDASYLELAIRKATPLATLERALVQAAKRRGVETLPRKERAVQ
ncbi:type II toxin-antitoxin system VapC family toxin [Candidatus Palauibacter sp.]|uniref:type II toxin-antitoxin system VapC family toxin n=1 Tax=Candidatus Palauibacter sp. TaxID=3101350 RepID=UPI003AF2218E